MDMSRVSACSYPVRKRPLEEALSVISDAGFHKIDLLGALPHLSLDPRECDPAAVKTAAKARGLHIANLGTYVGEGFASHDPVEQGAELGQVRRAIDVAVFLGARSIRVYAGDDEPACIDRIVPWYRRCAEYAAQQNVYMGIENHGGGISGQPELCKELAEKIGSPFFGVLYEPGNLMLAGTDYRAALEIMKDHIVHTHFKDGAHTGEGFEWTMIGEGEIDFPWVVAQLDALGYRGDFALEYEVRAEPPDTGLKRWFKTFAAM